jgi:hypothetical protein
MSTPYDRPAHVAPAPYTPVKPPRWGGASWQHHNRVESAWLRFRLIVMNRFTYSDEPLSNVAFNLYLRRYTAGCEGRAVPGVR